MRIKKESRKSHIIIIVLGLLVITLFLMEGVYRLLARSSFPPLEYMVPFDINRFDSQFGWSLIPGSHAVSNRTGVPVRYQINSHGFRGREYNQHKPDGVFRIVVIGDSNTFGDGVEERYHFLTLLEKYYKNVEVLNLGVSGFGIDQELLFLKKKGIKFEPDLVMAYVAHYSAHRHMNTVRWGRAKPMYLLKHGKLVLTNSPVPAPKNKVQDLVGEAYYFKVRKIHKFLNRRVGLYYFITIDLSHRLHKAYGKFSKKRLDNKAQKTHTKENSEEFKKAEKELGLKIVSEMDRLCNENGIPFVLIKGRFSEHLFVQSKDNNILSLSVGESKPNYIYKISAKLGHINPPGNGVLAWEIYRFLKKEELVPLENYRFRKQNNVAIHQ